MTYKPILLIICWLTTALNSLAGDSQRDAILSQITGAQIPKAVINIQKMGAKGNGTTDCLPAFQKAFKKAGRQGGARIVVPAGTYYIRGPLHLVSNVCLEIQEGATLKFAPDPELYLPAVKTSWEGTFLQNYSPFIYGYQLHDVSIIGKGTIDGNAMTTFATWRSKQKPAQQRSREMNHTGTPVAQRNFGEGDYLRPHLIQLFGCERITIEDVFITNSPFWCIHLLQSENAILRGIRFDAKLVNNDGIDPEMSRNILIEDVHFNNGDDNVAIKSGRDHDGRGLPVHQRISSSATAISKVFMLSSWGVRCRQVFRMFLWRIVTMRVTASAACISRPIPTVVVSSGTFPSRTVSLTRWKTFSISPVCMEARAWTTPTLRTSTR